MEGGKCGVGIKQSSLTSVITHQKFSPSAYEYLLLPPWRRRRGDSTTNDTPIRISHNSLSAQNTLREREAHHQSEFVRLPTFKQIGGAIKILPRQRGEERDDASGISAPGASFHDPDLAFFDPTAEGLKLQVGGDQPVDSLDGFLGDFEARVG